MVAYDYLIVGAGLFGATFAYEAAEHGRRIKVIEREDHIAGHIYIENIDGINVHEYGVHIFHTSNKDVWDYINQFAEYKELAKSQANVVFGGRLGQYKYYDMHQVIQAALKSVEREFN